MKENICTNGKQRPNDKKIISMWLLLLFIFYFFVQVIYSNIKWTRFFFFLLTICKKTYVFTILGKHFWHTMQILYLNWFILCNIFKNFYLFIFQYNSIKKKYSFLYLGEIIQKHCFYFQWWGVRWVEPF